MWYNAGTITVTAGSQYVDGQGTSFVGPVQASYGLLAPDGRLYEILQVISATRLQLVRPYAGGTVANVPYDIVPMTIDLSDLIARAQALVDRYQAFLGGVGQGAFPDGTVALPGLRFASDQDTGFRPYAANTISAVCGGADTVLFGPNGTSFIVGGARIAQVLAAGLGLDTSKGLSWAGNPNEALIPSDGVAGWLWKTDGRILIQFQNGTVKMVVDASGNLGVGTATPLARMHVLGSNTTLRVESANTGATDTQLAIVTPNRQWNIGQNVGGAGVGALNFFDVTAGSNRMSLDTAGNLLVGASASSTHTIRRSNAEGGQIIGFGPLSGESHRFYIAGQGGASSAACCYSLDRNGQTLRSINAAGTVNASGADYAEYMIKAAGCGIIAKGDVCGVDRDGKLTKTWADAISFAVKSTDPSLVGGDTWTAHMPPRPVDPGEEPQPPALPATPAEGADDAELAAYQKRLAAYPAQVAQHRVDHDAWTAATAAYARDLPAWEAELEAARVCVDRIAFCGQVPCNVNGDFEVGDYIVAAQDGDEIKAIAVKADGITLPQYMARIGKVWAIRDGRAWIDVQHG